MSKKGGKNGTKTRTVPLDYNVDPSLMNLVDRSPEDPSNTEMVILEKCRKARDILESLDIPEKDKEIFSWKFFADNSLRSWTGPESYPIVCNTFNRVRKQMVRKIKNPHSTRRQWTAAEIAYLKAEFPHIETMKIAVYLDRNYSSVEQMARRLELKKTTFAKRKILRRNSPMTS